MKKSLGKGTITWGPGKAWPFPSSPSIPDINLLEPAFSKAYQKYWANNLQPNYFRSVTSQNYWMTDYPSLDDSDFIVSLTRAHIEALKRWFKYHR